MGDDDLGPSLGDLIGLEPDSKPPFDPTQVTPGMLDLRVLHQDAVWVDRFGDVHELAGMGHTYRANVVAHLHAVCQWMWATTAVNELLDTPLAVHQLALEAGVPLTGDLDPHAWLESTPLVRALRRLSPGIAAPQILTQWAQRITDLSQQVGTDICAVPGSEIRMPQDPDRSWTHDMRQIPTASDNAPNPHTAGTPEGGPDA